MNDPKNSQNKPTSTQSIGLILFVVIVWGVMSFAIHQLTRDNTLGYDFFNYWNSTRAFIFDGLNPYSPEVAVQNQVGLFGHTLGPGNDPGYFRNPAFAILLVLPFVLVPFDWAQAIWMTFNILAVLATCFLAFPALPKWIPFLFLFFYPMMFGIIVGNLSILVGCILLLSIGVICLQGKNDFRNQIFIGILLTFSLVKPQFSWFFVLWILYYSFSKRLYTLAISFFATLTASSLIMLIFIPSWPADFLRMLKTYQNEVNMTPARAALFDIFVDKNIAILIGNICLILVILTTFFMVFRHKSIDKQAGIAQLAMVAISTFFAHPSGFSNELMFLLIPVLAWMTLGLTSQMVTRLTWITMFFLSYLAFFLEKFWAVERALLWMPILVSLIWTGYIYFMNRSQSFVKEISV